MTLIVVTGYVKETGMCHVVGVDSTTLNPVADYGMVHESSLPQACATANCAPLNFSIGADGRVVMDCGDFKRFSPSGSAVVLAEVLDSRRKSVGYRVISCANNACVTIDTQEIIRREAEKQEPEHFLQNAIIRNGAVCSYPKKPFLKVSQLPQTQLRRQAGGQVQPQVGQRQQSRPQARATSQNAQSHTMTVDEFKKAMRGSVLRMKKQIGDTNPVPKEFWPGVADMFRWLAGIQNQECRAEGIVIIKQETPNVAALVFDGEFVEMCPEVNSFFEKDATALAAAVHKSDGVTPETILNGTAAMPLDMAGCLYDGIVPPLISACKERFPGDNIPREKWPQAANVYHWLWRLPSSDMKTDAVLRLRNEVQSMIVLSFDGEFTQMCPECDKFFGSLEYKDLYAALDKEDFPAPKRRPPSAETILLDGCDAVEPAGDMAYDEFSGIIKGMIKEYNKTKKAVGASALELDEARLAMLKWVTTNNSASDAVRGYVAMCKTCPDVYEFSQNSQVARETLSDFFSKNANMFRSMNFVP